MILVIEPLRHGIEHQAFNASLLLVCRESFPDRHVRFYAEAEHLEAVRTDVEPHDRIEFERMDVPGRYERTLARAKADFRNARSVLEAAKHNGAKFVIFASVTPPILWYLALSTRLREPPRMLGILHGELTIALHPPRYNLAARLVSLRSSLMLAPRSMRYAVLEEPVLETVRRIAPKLARRSVLLPHPLPPDFADSRISPREPPPIRIGLLGLCTPQKGLLTFLELARRLADDLRGAVEFHIVGRIHVDYVTHVQSYAQYLAGQPSPTRLCRKQFVQRMTGLHYAAFFFEGPHYQSTASGVLLDCIALGLPLVGHRHPLLEGLIEAAGDIGEFCESGGEELMLRHLVEEFDAQAYLRRRMNMLRLKESRTPKALAAFLRSGLEA